jgi:catechol 2,3-dioxygenase-like lactoylglutathione lyase family enzyme
MTTQQTTTVVTLVGIHHVGLTVADIETSADWYQRVLGLERHFEERHHQSDAGGHCVVVGTPDMRLDIGLDHHPATAASASTRPAPASTT